MCVDVDPRSGARQVASGHMRGKVCTTCSIFLSATCESLHMCVVVFYTETFSGFQFSSVKSN